MTTEQMVIGGERCTQYPGAHYWFGKAGKPRWRQLWRRQDGWWRLSKQSASMFGGTCISALACIPTKRWCMTRNVGAIFCRHVQRKLAVVNFTRRNFSHNLADTDNVDV